jgi:hypothetical protein
MGQFETSESLGVEIMRNISIIRMFYKTLHRKLKFEQYEPNKTAHCDMFDITDIYLF